MIIINKGGRDDNGVETIVMLIVAGAVAVASVFLILLIHIIFCTILMINNGDRDDYDVGDIDRAAVIDFSLVLLVV